MTTRATLTTLAAASMPLVACMTTGSTGDGGAPNLPNAGFEAFAERYERAYCDMLASCPHASDDGYPTLMYTIGQATCLERARASVIAKNRKFLSQGLAAFDREAADRCIADLEESCIAMSAHVCADVVVGLSENGALCHDDAMCAGGRCTTDLRDCSLGICEVLEELPLGPVVYTVSGPGGPCQHHRAHQGCARGLACAYEDEVCLEPRVLGTQCSSYQPCTAGSLCAGSTCRAVRLSAAGEPCSESTAGTGPLALCDRFRNLECVQGVCIDNGLGGLGAECSRYPPDNCKPGLECQPDLDASGDWSQACGQPLDCPRP